MVLIIMETTKRIGRPLEHGEPKTRLMVRALPKDHERIRAIAKCLPDPMVLEVARLDKEFERVKRTNYDLATQNAKLLEEVEGYKAILG